MKTKIIISVIFCSLFLTFIFVAQSSDWQKIICEKGKFSIDFSAKPTIQDEPPLPKNDYLEMIAYQLDNKENNITFSASCKFIPEKINKKNYNKFCKDYIDNIPKKWKCELISRKEIDRESLKISELEMKLFPDIHIRMQVFWSNNIIYEISVIGKPDVLNNRDSEHFFNSFQLMK